MAMSMEMNAAINERMFPLQASYREKDGKRIPLLGPLRIPWSVAEKAYGVYAQRCGRSQSLERLAERGGFGVCEMDDMYPAWRDEVGEIMRLRQEVSQLQDWKQSAMTVLGEWDRVWEALGQPGPLGASKAVNTAAAVARVATERDSVKLRESQAVSHLADTTAERDKLRALIEKIGSGASASLSPPDDCPSPEKYSPCAGHRELAEWVMTLCEDALETEA